MLYSEFYISLCVAAVGCVIRLEMEMEGKMRNGEAGQGEMGFMLTCWEEGRGFIWLFVKTDVIALDSTSTASLLLRSRL